MRNIVLCFHAAFYMYLYPQSVFTTLSKTPIFRLMNHFGCFRVLHFCFKTLTLGLHSNSLQTPDLSLGALLFMISLHNHGVFETWYFESVSVCDKICTHQKTVVFWSGSLRKMHVFWNFSWWYHGFYCDVKAVCIWVGN